MQLISNGRLRVSRRSIRPAAQVIGLAARRTQQAGSLDYSARLRPSRTILGAALAMMLALGPSVLGQSNDPYALRFVSEVLQHYGHFSTGWEDKGLPRLGDKASIALIKLSSLDAWKDPVLVHKALGIIRDSFSHPELIEYPSDRYPSVTTLLLSWLKTIHQEQETIDEINRTEEFVEGQTKPK
ncbi:MAG: hypothetical protein P8020_09435 [Acidobacteriota bacterium]